VGIGRPPDKEPVSPPGAFPTSLNEVQPLERDEFMKSEKSIVEDLFNKVISVIDSKIKELEQWEAAERLDTEWIHREIHMLKYSKQMEGVGVVLKKFQDELNDSTNGGSTLNRLFRTCIREILPTNIAMRVYEFPWCDGDVSVCFTVGQIDYLRLEDSPCAPFFEQNTFLGYDPEQDDFGNFRDAPMVKSINNTIDLVLKILYYFNNVNFDEFVSATNGHWRETIFKGKGPYFYGIAETVAEVLFPKEVFHGFSGSIDLFVREFVRLRDLVGLRGRSIAEEMEKNMQGFKIKGSTPTEYYDLDSGKSFRNIYYRNKTRNTRGGTKTTQTTQPA
jgi:hypothetical protein